MYKISNTKYNFGLTYYISETIQAMRTFPLRGECRRVGQHAQCRVLVVATHPGQNPAYNQNRSLIYTLVCFDALAGYPDGSLHLNIPF